MLIRCRRWALAIAVLGSLTSAPVVAASVPGELRRADTLDMRRAGKVSEDERAVLRIEWRAGLSGVDADRKLQEITAKLRQVEAGMGTVNQLIRNMPSEQPASARKAPVAVEEAGDGELDWRLMAANITALVLVAIWWVSRRKTQLAAAALEAKLAAKTRAEPNLPAPAEAEAKVAETLTAERQASGISVATPVPEPTFAVLEQRESAAPLPPTDVASDVVVPQVPARAAAPDTLAAPAAAEGLHERLPLEETPPMVDFVLEEADPATVVPERPRPPTKPVAAVTPASVSASLNKNVEPTLQLAEIMLSMGLEQGAAQTLVEYTEANPKHAIYHMLKLLGIYRKRGLHKEFQETAEKLRKNFNIQAEDWAKTDSGDAPSLEGFSRVSQHVQSIWNQPEECITYLRHLIEDNRDGARAGFPQSVAEEILLLVEILKETSGSTQEVA